MANLLEILNDPNYVNANEATKEAIFNKYSAQDKNYSGANEATQEAIRNKFGIGVPVAAEAEPEPSKDTGIMSMIGRGVARGAKQTGSALFDVLPAMAASAVGADEYAAKQMEEAAQTQREIEQKYGARYKSLSDVKGVGDYIPFALETISEQVPNIATALVPGAGLGVAGGRMAATAAAKKLAEREATEAGAKYAAMKTAQGVSRGQMGGAFLGSYALNAPEVFENIYEETGGQMEPGAALLAGSVSAALDAVLPAYLLNKLTPGVKAGVVERLLEKSGMPSDVARKVIGGAVTGAATEGPTEAAQEAISIVAEKFVQDNPEVWGSKEFNRLIESGVRGAVGGGGFGAIGGAGQALINRPSGQKTDAEFKEVVTEDFRAGFEEANGRAPTKAEEDTFVSNVIKARNAEEAPSEPTGIDTRTDEPSVSVPSEPEIKADGVAVGTEGITPRSVDGDTGVAGTPTAGETVEPSALTEDEIVAKAQEFQDKRKALLTPTGRIPLANSKKGKEYQALVVAEEDFVRNANAQRRAAEQQTAPTVEAAAVDTDPLQNYFATEARLNSRMDELIAENENLTQEQTDLRNRGIDEGDASKYDNDIEAAKTKFEENKKEFASVYEQRQALEVPEVSAPTSTTPTAVEEAAPAAAPPQENIINLEQVVREKQLSGMAKEAVDGQFKVLSDLYNAGIATDADLDAYAAAILEAPDQMLAVARGTKVLNPIKDRQKAESAKRAAATAANTEVKMAQGDTVSPPKPKKQTKIKKQIDDFLDEIDDVPDRLSRDDLDNLLADPAATKKGNTSPKANQVPVNDPLFKSAHPTVLRAINDNDIAGVLKALKNTAGTFISSFADRVMGLGITTQIGWDDVHVELAMKSLSTVDGQKNRIINWIKQIYPEVYRNKFDESKMQTPVTQMLASFQELRDGKLGIPPKMFMVDLEDVIKRYSDTITTLNAPGTYFTDYNAIGLSLERGGGSNYVVVHEITHAATHWAINNPDKLNDKQLEALGKLKGLYEFAKLNTKNPGQYGYNNLHEFVAEAFSRPEFQDELRKMNAGMETDMSAWSKFIQLVARLFGVDNVLFHTLANADVLFSANSGNPTNMVMNALWSPSRYDVKEGKFTLNPGESMGFINSLIKNRANWGSADKSNVKKFFGSLNNQYRRYLLGALTIDQMADIYGADMPQLKLYAKEVDAMIATRNAILTDGDPIITSWSNLLNENPQKAEQLGKAMIEATIKKNDPDPKGAGHNAKEYATDASLKKAWTDLTTGKDGDTAVKIYREVRDFYDRRMQEYVKVQVKRIEEYGKVKGLTDEEIAAKQLAFKRDTEEKIIRPYFPIKRFGDYFLMVGKGKNKIFMQFEDAFARDAELEVQKAKLVKTLLGSTTGLSAKEIEEKTKAANSEAEGMLWPGQGFNEVLNQKLSDVTQLNKINELIDESTEAILKSKDPKVTADQVAALQAELKDQFGQYYLELLPSESIKKMFLHRENVAGPSQDMLRAFGLSRERIAYQRARFQHMPDLFNIVEAAKIRSKSMPTTDEKSVYGDVANELAKNFKGAVLEPPKQNKLTTYLTHFGFLNFLTAPASALVNTMAIPVIYGPVAGAKYGYANVNKALAKYMRMLGGTGYKSETTGRIEFLSLARAKLAELPLLDKAGKQVIRTDADGNKIPVTMADVYQYGVNRNVIDTTLSHESVSIGERPSMEYTGRWQKFMYYASLPFHSAEKFNREVTFMSSFDLAYDKFIKPVSEGGKGMTGDKAYAAALEAARDLTQETMFNYNTTNKPRYFRGNIASVVLQFKMYPQHMSVLLARTFYKSITQNEQLELDRIRENLKTAPPEELAKALADKQAELADIRREATKAFWGMLGTAFLSAGVTGMPLWFVFSGVMSAFHAVFGEDDEPFDPENWFKNWAGRTFGGFLGDSISRGLVSQATGMNFADRMNMNLTDMWFPDVRKSQDEVDYMQNMFINLLGPSVGALLVNYPEALKRYNDGHVERAIEGMMPAAIKNAMAGTRYLVEGQALTLKGNTLVEDITAREALSQMIGFSPERVAQKQKSTIEAKNINESIKARRTDLLNAFFIAVDAGDEDMLDRVLEKLGKFNATVPELAINGETLSTSVYKRYQDRALANSTGGMGLDKKLIPRLEGMLDYGNQ
jgi:Large polyvalent protein associated domain 39